MKARAFVAIFVLGLCSPLSSANESMSYASHLQPSVQHMGSTQYHGNLLAQRPEVEGVIQHKPEGDTTRVDTKSTQDKEDAYQTLSQQVNEIKRMLSVFLQKLTADG